MRDKTKTPAENLWGTYQTTFRIETWVRGRKIPRVQYTTTFSGKVEDHNSILELVRELHAGKDGQASALVEVFEKAGKWTKLKEEDPDATIILSEVFNEAIEELNFLRNQLEDITVIMSGKKGISMNLQIAAVKKILDKEFESSGDSIISRHRAAKTWIQRYKPPGGSFNRLNQQPFIELEKILETG